MSLEYIDVKNLTQILPLLENRLKKKNIETINKKRTMNKLYEKLERSKQWDIYKQMYNFVYSNINY